MATNTTFTDDKKTGWEVKMLKATDKDTNNQVNKWGWKAQICDASALLALRDPKTPTKSVTAKPKAPATVKPVAKAQEETQASDDDDEVSEKDDAKEMGDDADDHTQDAAHTEDDQDESAEAEDNQAEASKKDDAGEGLEESPAEKSSLEQLAAEEQRTMDLEREEEQITHESMGLKNKNLIAVSSQNMMSADDFDRFDE